MTSTNFADSWPSQFESFVAGLEGEPAATSALRERGRARFAEVGFPTLREEDWRHTNVAPLARSILRAALPPGMVDAAAVSAEAYEGCDQLVFIDGCFSVDMSRVGDLPDGVVVGDLASLLRFSPQRIEPWLGRLAALEVLPFVALNTAFLDQGAVVLLPRGAVLERPIQLLFLSTGAAAGSVSYPRILVVADELSQATLVEKWVGLTDEPYFQCVVSEIFAAPSATLDCYKLQREGRGAFHIAAHHLLLDRDSTVALTSISEGGGLVRNDIRAKLDGEGGQATLNGLYLATDRQLVDHHMWVEHAKPHCDSHELFKGILDGHSRAVFSGRIFVHKGAQKTDAKQTNRNLLLSDNALVNSNPQLEIFADDVRCTHGSTVGQLDDDAVFYLRSRGIEEDAARSLLTWAFASELVETMKVEPLRREVEEFLLGRLVGGDVVRQAL